MKPHTFITLAFGLAFLGACSSPEQASQPDRAEIEAELREFEDAYAAAVVSGDVEEILQFYAPDLISLPPNEPIQRGRTWVRDLLDVYFRDFDFREEFEIQEFRVFDDRLAVILEYRGWGTVKASGPEEEG